jgi:hypothetical protein
MSKITLSISLNEAKILYKEVTLERKLELEELFPELKPQLITDRVKTYVDALKVLKRDHFDENNLYPREIARRKLEIIIEALNEGWKPDLENYCQIKWYPYFYGASEGFGYSYAKQSPSAVLTNVGVHLCCKSDEIASYVGQQFLDLYKEMFLG